MKKFQIPYFIFHILVLFALILFFTQQALAAELDLFASKQEFFQGESIPIKVFLNTDNESINTIEVKISYSKNLMLKNWSDGNSIISFWVEKPNVEGEIISFSGIIPGGYQGKEGLILTLDFEADNEGKGLITILNSARLFLNDSLGTKAELIFKDLEFNISRPSEPFKIPDSKFQIPDTEPPESFKPEITADPAIFDGKWFLVFATQDKGSGIDGYAIHESPRIKTRISTNELMEDESPYLLKDQNLRSYIYVKAVDKAGNERIAMLEPRYPFKWYERWENWFIILIGFFIICAFVRLRLKSKIKK